LNVLTNPPRNRWNDVLAAPDIQTSQTPSYNWDFLAFNLEDPEEPKNAFDWEGNPIEQEPNPYFSDIRVRQAIQYAVNVPELIEVGLQGQGTQLAAMFSPYAYPYDDSLHPYGYDPQRARDLLNEAGWVQQGNNRICVHCGTAEEGSPMSLNLSYGSSSHHYPVATLIARQLYEVGINTSLSGGSDSVYYQNFDLYLGTWGAPYASVGIDAMFSPQEDIVGFGWNFTSYNNPEVSDLLSQARYVEGCSLDERIDYYQEAQRILYEDLPYAWLYAHDTRLAVHGSVQNFAPSIGEPLGNMRDWTVFDVPERLGR
jgi:peptide/nickel transport system substrate-binding protein